MTVDRRGPSFSIERVGDVGLFADIGISLPTSGSIIFWYTRKLQCRVFTRGDTLGNSLEMFTQSGSTNALIKYISFLAIDSFSLTFSMKGATFSPMVRSSAACARNSSPRRDAHSKAWLNLRVGLERSAACNRMLQMFLRSSKRSRLKGKVRCEVNRFSDTSWLDRSVSRMQLRMIWRVCMNSVGVMKLFMGCFSANSSKNAAAECCSSTLLSL
mmetsp:Transcript_43114/g.82226  ORF Transcript_43114/g.82226 Transcript_43114/m.82226 type:complete len:214 (+) Transcript_43114:448-1089(+)